MMKSCERLESIINDLNLLLHCRVSQKSISISGAHLTDLWLPGRYEFVASICPVVLVSSRARGEK